MNEDLVPKPIQQNNPGQPQQNQRRGMIEDPNPFGPKKTVGISQALEQDPKEQPRTSTIRTFQSDIAGAVKSDNVSMIKIALAEKERREHEGGYAELDHKTKIKPAYFVAAAVLMLMLGGAGFVYYYYNRPAPLTLKDIIASKEPEIIYAESQIAISTNDKAPVVILEGIKTESEKKFDLGTIKRMFLTYTVGTSTKGITSQEFLEKLRSRASDQFKRSIEPYFVVGAYSFAPHDTFIIFKTNSYDNAYASMLEWEPYIETDIGGMFATTIAPDLNNTSVPANNSTSSSSPNRIEGDPEQQEGATASPTPTVAQRTTTDRTSAVFQDRILQNKDTRVLVTPAGEIKLLYSFLDKNTLVIVSSEKGLKEIIFRMTSGRIIR